MTLTSTWKTLKDKIFILTLFALLFLIVPGITGIYLYLPELFKSLDWVKLILLSIAFTAPFAIANAAFIDSFENRKKEKNDDLFKDFILGASVTGVMAYLVILVSYALSFSISHLLISLAATELIIVFVIWIDTKRSKKK